MAGYSYKNCRLCPRNCGVDRTETVGYCGSGSTLKAARAGLHFYEEPYLSGASGSGTVFFTGCSLGCIYCQNYEISGNNVVYEKNLQTESCVYFQNCQISGNDVIAENSPKKESAGDDNHEIISDTENSLKKESAGDDNHEISSYTVNKEGLCKGLTYDDNDTLPVKLSVKDKAHNIMSVKLGLKNDSDTGFRGSGLEISVERLADIFIEQQKRGANNINLVTGTHFTPSIAEAIKIARCKGLTIPTLWNSSGYEKVETLQCLEGLIDIWLPDFKTLSPDLGKKYMNATDYPAVAKEILDFMVSENEKSVEKYIREHSVADQIQNNFSKDGMQDNTGKYNIQNPFGEDSMLDNTGKYNIQNPFGEDSMLDNTGKYNIQNPFGEDSMQDNTGKYNIQNPFGEDNLQENVGKYNVQNHFGEKYIQDYFIKDYIHDRNEQIENSKKIYKNETKNIANNTINIETSIVAKITNNIITSAISNTRTHNLEISGGAIFKNDLMIKGVNVRHLVLPGFTEESKNVIEYLYNRYGDKIWISIMSQYTPVRKLPYKELNRKLTRREYEKVVNFAIDIGVENAMIQEGDVAETSFIPRFDGEGIHN